MRYSEIFFLNLGEKNPWIIAFNPYHSPVSQIYYSPMLQIKKMRLSKFFSLIQTSISPQVSLTYVQMQEASHRNPTLLAGDWLRWEQVT